MVWTVYVMIVIRKDLPRRDGEVVLMRRDNSSVVQWVVHCKGGKDDVLAGGRRRIFGALEVKGKWCFQVKRMGVMGNSLGDPITRYEPSIINAELKYKRSDVNWREQVTGG